MKKRTHKKDDVVGMVTKGAAGVAVTAGVIAAGVALANRKNRQRLTKTIQKGIETLQEKSEIVKERLPKYHATTHTVRGRKNKQAKKLKHTKRKA